MTQNRSSKADDSGKDAADAIRTASKELARSRGLEWRALGPEDRRQLMQEVRLSMKAGNAPRARRASPK